MNYSKKSMLYLGIVCSMLMLGCEKDFAPTSSQSNQSSQNAKVLELNETQFDQWLSTFWSNYASYKGVAYDNGITPDLTKTLHKSEAQELLHYALNIAYVNLDTTYEIEQYDSLSIPVQVSSENDFVTMGNICAVMNVISNFVKEKHSSLSNQSHCLNRLTVKWVGATNIIRVRITMTSGDIWSTSKFIQQASINKYFPNPIPWLTKKSIPDEINPIISPRNQSNYLTWLFDNKRSGVDVSDRIKAFNYLTNDKPAHQHFSSGAIFWPDPLAQMNGWTHVIINKKAVETTGLVFPGTSFQVVIKRDPSRDYIYDDVNPMPVMIPPLTVNCGNPKHPGNLTLAQIGPDHMVPSSILGYYKREYDFNLKTARLVEPVALNFFWKQRPSVMLACQNRIQAMINQRMAAIGNIGFYAATEHYYLPHLDQDAGGTCAKNPPFCTFEGVCLHSTEYYLSATFSHFTMQNKLPDPLYSLLQL